MKKPHLFAFDLESTLVLPEVWIAVAERTGIRELQRTTADEPDYGKLMRSRIQTLREHGITIDDIRNVVDVIKPIEGAKEFLDELRKESPVVIISDTFYEYAGPIFDKIDNPLIMCHSLSIDKDGFITDFHIREGGTKAETVAALQSVGFEVTAIGDSFNDTQMLQQADRGIFIHAPEHITAQFPEFTSCTNYSELNSLIFNV